MAAVRAPSCFNLANETETEMKMIMAALTASALIAGVAAPASAAPEMTVVEGEYMQAPSAAAIKRVKMRRYVERQIEYDANKLPVGTGIWWLTFTHYSTEPIFVALDAIELLAGTAVVDAHVYEVVERSDQVQRVLIGIVGEGLAVADKAGVRVEPFDFFGEMSLLDGGPRSVTVRAATALRVLVIDRKNFQQLLREVPELTQRLLVTLSRRVRALESTDRG